MGARNQEGIRLSYTPDYVAPYSVPGIGSSPQKGDQSFRLRLRARCAEDSRKDDYYTFEAI
jgi:hypothetical protein